MFDKILWFASLLLSFLVGTGSLAQASELVMAVGESKVLPSPPTAKVRIGSRRILGAVDEGTQVRLIALKPGETVASIGHKTYPVTVTTPQQKKFLLALRELLSERMGLKAQTSDGRIEVTGELLRFEDWFEVSQLARKYNGDYTFQAIPLPDVAEKALSHFRQLARTEHWPNMQLTATPQVIAKVPGSAKRLLPEVKRTLRPYGMEAQVESSSLEVQPLIRTRVILAEMSKDMSQDIGIEWPAAYQAQIVPKWQNPSSILLNLRAMESRGLGKVLAAPNLSCRSGSEAQFHAGGEFPIRVMSRLTKDVVWKKHGVILKVKPVADSSGHISLSVETEISLLDMAHAVDGIPALKTNRVQSHFDLQKSKTIALSGLIRQDWGDSKEGVLALSQIPVIGWLFGSEKFLNHQSELVIFVTPEVVDQDSQDVVKMPEGWTNELE